MMGGNGERIRGLEGRGRNNSTDTGEGRNNMMETGDGRLLSSDLFFDGGA